MTEIYYCIQHNWSGNPEHFVYFKVKMESPNSTDYLEYGRLSATTASPGANCYTETISEEIMYFKMWYDSTDCEGFEFKVYSGAYHYMKANG